MISRRSLLLGALAPRRGSMARIPGGAFRMGADMDALLRIYPNAGPRLKSMLAAETPAREVTLRPFFMDRYEVTNAEFQRFMRGRKFPRHAANLPVANITWEEAAAYAAWAGKRLPAEAEWEFAARGGMPAATYPWGNEEPAPDRVNFRRSGLGHPAPVGSYPPNRYGLYDMAGNVWEFCQDSWAGSWERKVIRGGSYDGDAFNLRITARDSHQRDNPVPFVGFRCARNA